MLEEPLRTLEGYVDSCDAYILGEISIEQFVAEMKEPETLDIFATTISFLITSSTEDGIKPLAFAFNRAVSIGLQRDRRYFDKITMIFSDAIMDIAYRDFTYATPNHTEVVAFCIWLGYKVPIITKILSYAGNDEVAISYSKLAIINIYNSLVEPPAHTPIVYSRIIVDDRAMGSFATTDYGLAPPKQVQDFAAVKNLEGLSAIFGASTLNLEGLD